MIKTKFDFSGLEKFLESNKGLRRKFDEAIRDIALEIFEESHKYFSRTTLFYNCPNIMRRMGKAIPDKLLKMIKNDPYFTLRERLKPKVFTSEVKEKITERVGREFIKAVLKAESEKIDKKFLGEV